MARGFEIVSQYAQAGLHVPYRTTKQAAGYDFEAAEDFTLPSIWKMNFIKVLWQYIMVKRVLQPIWMRRLKSLNHGLFQRVLRHL